MNMPANAALNKTPSAIATIMFTVFMLGFGDAIIKGLSPDFTLWQIFCLRSALVLPALLIILKFTKWRSRVRPKSFWRIKNAQTTLAGLLGLIHVSLGYLCVPVCSTGT